MYFRPESSKNQRKQSDEDDELKGAAVAIAAVAGVAGLAAWGISKLIGGNTEEKPRASGSALYRLEQAYSETIQHTTPLKWTKPKPGYHKLNTDASLVSGEAFGGGVIRDHTGELKVGFMVKLGMCDVTCAEMKSVKEGVSLAWDVGIRKIEVETDSEQVVNYLTNRSYVDLETHYLRTIIKECRELMGYNWVSFEISHVKNNRNKCADLLAGLARNMSSPFIVFYVPPNEQVRNRLQIDQKDS